MPIVAPGNGLQDFTGCTIDVNDVLGPESYLSINGTVGGDGCQASVDLFAGPTGYPDSGAPTDLAHQWNLDPGAAISIGTYLDGETAFHFGADGNWNSPVGQTNTVTVTFYVSTPVGTGH
jgi:hypothetical protein